MGWQRVLREVVPIFLGFKPAVDAYRVATGVKQEAGQNIDATHEMNFMKCIEMFAEAIPGVIIQLMAIGTLGKDENGDQREVTLSAWISLAVSAFSTGFISASISYDFDTNPEKRQQVPEFYGYVPAQASKRTTVFGTMVFFSAGMLLIRCTTILLLGLIGKRWAFAYIGADLGLYLLVKIMRGDFWYWVPVGGKMEILLSLLCRVVVKIITDFTSLVQFRHPYELGGMYWLFSFVLTMGSLPAAIKFYEGKDGDELVVDLAWRLLYILIPSTLVMLSFFFTTIERSYRHTFMSTIRGKDLTIKNYRESDDDATKAAFTFQMSKHHWNSIEEEVRGWVEANWSIWEEEKPKWLDENIRTKIPVDYIPTAEAREKEKQRQRLTKNTHEGTTATETSEIRTIPKKPKTDMYLSSLKAAVARNKQDQEESTRAANKLRRKLLDRGAVEGLLTSSTKEQQKTTQYAVVYHTPPSIVWNYILSDQR